MRLLVTGATGELGTPLLERLRESGYQLSVLSRRDITFSDSQIRVVRGDLSLMESLKDAVKDADIILHLAAATHARSDKQYQQVNVEGTSNLLKVAKNNNVRQFIFLSTRAVGKEGGGYSYSKLIAEERVKASGINWVILRPAEVYGNGGKDPIAKLVEAVKRRKFIPVLSGEYNICPVHVDDVIAALVRTIDNKCANGKTYTLAGPEVFSFRQLIHLIEGMTKCKCRMVPVPALLVKWAANILGVFNLSPIMPDQVDRLLLAKSTDSARAAEDLSFRPRTLREGFPWPR